MRLLIPAWSFYPAQEGGPSNAMYWMASGLAKAGYEVRVVTTNRYIEDADIKFNEWQDLNGFKVIYQTLDQRPGVIYDEVDHCDCILSNGVCMLKGLKINLRAIRRGKKVILSPRGEFYDAAIDHKGKLYGFLKRCIFFLMRFVYGKKIIYHATSEEEVGMIKKYMGKSCNVVLIPNYMILPERVPDDKIKADKDYLLYVGRLNRIKNLDILIEGLFRSKIFRNSNLKMLFAGEKKGEFYQSLVDQIKTLGFEEKIEFLGMVTGETKNVLYANAKCLFLVSKSENFGNVIIEGLSQGTPAITSKGTPWQSLQNANAGYWIDATPERIGETVDRFLSLNPEEYSQIRESSYNLSRIFDIHSNIEKWSDVLESRIIF